MNIDVKVCERCGKIHLMTYGFSYCSVPKCWGKLIVIKLNSKIVEAGRKLKD